MASATPDLRLPSQPQSITALWPVPNYIAFSNCVYETFVRLFVCRVLYFRIISVVSNTFSGNGCDMYSLCMSVMEFIHGAIKTKSH